MQYRILESEAVTTLVLSGNVVVGDRGEFEEITDAVFEHSPRRISVDLTDLDYMDSAGLGLLLMLRERSLSSGTHLVLANPSGQVGEVFETAGFDILFHIE